MKPVVSLASRARIPNGIVFQNLQDELVLLNLNTGVYFGLDRVGARIWQLIQTHQDTPLRQVLDKLTGEYKVRQDRCAGDLLNLVARLEENRLLEIRR
jgi:hypothetical protein